MAAGDVMTGAVALLAGDYITLRRGLGYRSRVSERYLRAFARYLDREGHDGPVPLERSLDWAASTASADPCNPSRRLTTVRGFLRHLSALDGATEVPAPGMLGPTGHRTPPHVYSDREIADLLRAAAGLVPAGGLRPRCYATLFGLLACTGCGSPKRSRSRVLTLTWPAASSLSALANPDGPGWCRCIPAPWHHWRTTPRSGNAATGRLVTMRCSSAPTAATTSATTLPTTPSPCFAGSWAGPRPAAPARPACTTYGTGWWCDVSR